jgi:hypothetical protein
MLCSADASPSEDLVDDDKEVISIHRYAKEGENGESHKGTAVIYGYNLAVWLLSVLACHDEKSKIVIMEAGAVEVLTNRISSCISHYSQVKLFAHRKLKVFQCLVP